MQPILKAAEPRSQRRQGRRTLRLHLRCMPYSKATRSPQVSWRIAPSPSIGGSASVTFSSLWLRTKKAALPPHYEVYVQFTLFIHSKQTIRMKKQFFAAAMILALGVGMTACSSDDLNVKTGTEASQKATTYMTVSFSMPTSDTRAADDGQDKDAPDFNRVGQWEGQDKIEKVSVYVFSGAAGSETLEKKQDYTAAQLAFAKNVNGNAIVTPNSGFKVTAGQKTVYVVLNPNAAVATLLDAQTTLANFKTAYESENLSFTKPTTRQAYYTTGDETLAGEIAKVDNNQDVILMTGASATQNIADNVTEAQAVAGVNNRVPLTVKRAVARVIVTTKANEFEIKGNDPSATTATEITIAKLTNLTYVVAQGEAKLFFQQKAQDPANTDGMGYVTPASSKKLTQTGDFWKKEVQEEYQAFTADYDYSGLWKNTVASPALGTGVTIPTLAQYTKQAGATTFGEIKSNLGTGEFVLPNVHKFAANDRAQSGYQLGNSVYILVRGILMPQKYVDNNGVWSTTPATAAQDWYVGANGVFYANQAHVQEADKHGVPGQTARLYKGGKVLYTLFVNPDDLVKPINSPVTRNNIYHVQISGVGKIGANWNPLVPPTTPPTTPPTKPGEVPANPQNPDDFPKDNPFEPLTPPNDPRDPLSSLETWMSVNVTILPWQVHSYEVTL